MPPWLTPWWGELVKCAEKGGKSGWDIVHQVSSGHAVGYEVCPDGYLVLERTHDDALRVWLGVGRGVRNWHSLAEQNVVRFANEIGCNKLLIEGRKGWRRVLKHWTVNDDGDLELRIAP